MQCDYLDWYGGILGYYYCRKDDTRIDKNTINNYCDNSLNYRNCPIYNKSSSNGGCYLTTAMCNILGYEDHCYALDTLRDFRDNYMKKTPECLPLLEDYDLIGPKISQKLEEDKNKIRTANIMLTEFITPAIICIKREDYDNAIEIYEDMTLGLMDYYGFDTKELACKKETKIKKQRKRTTK